MVCVTNCSICKALSTWGTVAEYKYFLPRVLELSMSDDPPGVVAVTLGKLSYGEFQSWPQKERAAVEHFVVSLWEAHVKDTSREAMRCCVELPNSPA